MNAAGVLTLVLAWAGLAAGPVLAQPSPARSTASAAITAAQTATQATALPLPARLDDLRRLGDDWPAQTHDAFAALAATHSQQPAQRRAVALARAEVAARSESEAALGEARAAATRASDGLPVALIEADQAYLDALRAEHDGAPGLQRLAAGALARYERWCQATARSQAVAAAAAASTAATPAPADNAAPDRLPASCESHTRWRLHQLLGLRAASQQATESAREHQRAALALARDLDDPWRLSSSLGQLAMAAAKGNDRSQAQQLLVQALAQARRTGNATQQARLQLVQAQVAMVLGEHASAAPLLDLVLAQAHQAGAARLEAAVRANRADLALNLKQPRAALADAQAGLPIAERLGERRMQRVLQHNAMLARVALGERHSAQHDLEALQEAWGAEGNTGMQVATLREYADALADAGDAAAALTVHHRERALSRQLSEANRTAALTELRGRYDREAQQREIRLLASDNAVKAAELMQQTLARRLWLLGGSALALALALTALLVLRVRETNRQLEHSRIRLRLQSERDALTGLANRRHFQTVLQQSIAASPDGGLQGALLMLDIDHFKQINDGHGHAAGDAVLVEVARRIADSLREADTVARWGGEEFLVLAPALRTDELDALAARLLLAIAGTPVALPDGTALRVTTSIGHARVPLPPHAVPLRGEQAINLVDMALYLAKGQGRNRAVGIHSVAADSAAALQALEADFERGCSQGQVVLRVLPGPSAAPADPMAAHPAHPGGPQGQPQPDAAHSV